MLSPVLDLFLMQSSEMQGSIRDHHGAVLPVN
jgi:hypothetical protein